MVSCRIKAYCLHEGLGPEREVPSVEVSLRDSSPYVCEFRRKTQKTRNSYRSTMRSETEPGTSRLPVSRAEKLGHWWGSVSQGIMSILFFHEKLKLR